jgi:hypothetical protein
LRIVGFVVLGFVIGYYAGAYTVCTLNPGMNLCGLAGAFVTGPIGGMIGGVIAWRRQRSKRA